MVKLCIKALILWLSFCNNDNCTENSTKNEVPKSPGTNPSNTEGQRAGAGRRFSARLFDIWLCEIILGIVIELLGGGAWLANTPTLGIGFILLPFALLMEVIVYAGIGSTFGRWCFSTTVRNPDGTKISAGKYAKRTFRLYFSGLLIGFPLLSAIAMLVQEIRVSRGKETSYDHAMGLHVTQSRQGFLKAVVTILFLILCLCLTIMGQSQGPVPSPPRGIELNELGLRYLYGDGVERNLAEAEKKFQAAGREGLPIAWYNLAVTLAQTPGREKEVGQALLKAACAGVPDAQYEYGCYLANSDLSRIGEAVDWVRKAARAGHERAKRDIAAWDARNMPSGEVPDSISDEF